MEQVRYLIDMIASDQMADAKDVMDEVLSANAFQRMEDMKHDIASSLYGSTGNVNEGVGNFFRSLPGHNSSTGVTTPFGKSPQKPVNNNTQSHDISGSSYSSAKDRSGAAGNNTTSVNDQKYTVKSSDGQEVTNRAHDTTQNGKRSFRNTGGVWDQKRNDGHAGVTDTRSTAHGNNIYRASDKGTHDMIQKQENDIADLETMNAKKEIERDM